MVKKILCLAFLVLLAVSVAGHAQVSDEAGVSGSTSFPPPDGSNIILYDQTSNASGNGAPDQDFEAAFNAYDCEGADDFEITFANGWDVNQINTVGSQSIGGTPNTVDVAIYADGGGTPAAAPQCEYLDLTSFTGTTSLSITLPSTCSLMPGVWWVAIQVQQDFGVSGQHFWSNRSVQSGNESVWRNPGNGFGTGCTDWMPQTSCGVGGGASPDFLFQIVGEERTVPVPTIGPAVWVLLLASLVLVSLYFYRRRSA